MATNNWMTPLGGTTTGGPTQPPDVLWDPSHLSSTSIWIDIDALGLSNGTGITTMTDQSGNNYDMGGVSTYATVVSADLNGLDVAQFNNLGGYTLSNWPGPFGNDGQVFAGVVEIDAVAATSYISETRAAVPATQLTPLIYRSNQTLTPSNQRRDGADTDVDLTASVPSTTGWAIVVLAHDYINGGINCLVNGTSVATGTLTSTGSGPETNLTVGLGSSATNTFPWEDKIAEGIWFDDRLSTGSNGDLERVEGYLAHKYALTANLPSGHPYKSSPPVWAQISGGTETLVDGYKYSTFTSGSTLTASTGGVVEYLIVGGGGGGSQSQLGGGGGGGAGGFLSGTAAVTPQSYTITVGDGGAANAGIADGESGDDSAAFGLTAIGGGGGGYFRGGGGGVGLTGGSGGGAGANRDGTRAGGTGTAGQGNDGSTGLVTSGVASQSGGGGGGGAGSAGSISTTSVGGAGGAGAEWPTGSGTYYAAGGQAGHGNNSTTTVSGAANTGNGGTGSQSPTTAGNGGSGIVIVRSKVWAQASGGTETTSGGYKYHTFTGSSGTLTVSSAGSVEYCIVAGGGGGSKFYGGGGGAGGVLTGTQSLTAQSYSITVGAGGAGNSSNFGLTNNATNSGEDSTAFGLTAIGGGAGGNQNVTPAIGGSGGGAGYDLSGAAGTAGQGNAGGDGVSTASCSYTPSRGSGGGGGASQAGGNGSCVSGGGTNTGDGGDGLEWPTSSGNYYGGGGGGSINQYNAAAAGSGGLGGGGDGGISSTPGSNGAANTGGGGGGTADNSSNGGNGGSGIVIVRYPV